VVEEVADLWALDRSRLFPAASMCSAAGSRRSRACGPRISHRRLVRRIAAGGIDEVVLAMNATLEGQTTAHYIAERIESFPSASPSSRTACRSAASSTISTRARSPRRCARGGRWPSRIQLAEARRRAICARRRRERGEGDSHAADAARQGFAYTAISALSAVSARTYFSGSRLRVNNLTRMALSLTIRRPKPKSPPWPSYHSRSPGSAPAHDFRAGRRVDDELARADRDMFETMYAAPGIGLAAIQVGVPKRVIVMDLQEQEDEEGKPIREPRVFINAEILDPAEEHSVYTEGCLSVPDQYADVERPARCRVQWLDEQGAEHDEVFEGLLATCIQHEMDHLEGSSSSTISRASSAT
jgi:peptide deformylase